MKVQSGKWHSMSDKAGTPYLDWGTVLARPRLCTWPWTTHSIPWNLDSPLYKIKILTLCLSNKRDDAYKATFEITGHYANGSHYYQLFISHNNKIISKLLCKTNSFNAPWKSESACVKILKNPPKRFFTVPWRLKNKT